MKQFILLLYLVLHTTLAVVFAADPWADSVVSVQYGPGAGFGRDFFPDNVLGPPDSAASAAVPSANPAQLLALGSGGVIVLAFLDGGIDDGPGPDFTVFENPFYYGDPAVGFAETGIVAVSDDGAEWFEFPYDPITFAGLAGVTPTNGSGNPLDPETSGGDVFDLAETGLAHARYVRITDAGALVNDSGDSFDLDAVAVIHGENGEAPPESQSSRELSLRISAWPNPFNDRLTVILEGRRQGGEVLQVFNTTGKRVLVQVVSGSRWTWSPSGLSSGVYFIRVGGDFGSGAVKRVVFLR